jgi:CBS domain containing-hemolysin-like protein
VGVVAAAHDRTRAGARRLRDGAWLLPALMRPDEVRDRLHADIPDGPAYETLGGFVMARLGRLARTGDEVVVGGGVLRVERMDGRRIDRLRFAPQRDEAAGRVPAPTQPARRSPEGAR